MNNGQINKINMFQTVNLVLITPENRFSWNGFPAFVRSQGRLATSLNLLAALGQAQETPITGITLDKDALKTTLVERTLIVAGAAGTYAFEANNQTLAAKFDVKEGELKNLRDSLLDDAAQAVHDEAGALVTADAAKMAEFHLDPETLADLQSAITAYSATVGTPRAAIAGRTAITKAIAAEIDSADENLKRSLDRLILQFQTDHPTFVSAYESARKIVDSASGHTAKPDVPPAPAA